MIRLTAGVPAFNEEERIAVALHSLLDQDLPQGTDWDAIWVIASGCTDRTVERAGGIDPRVHVVEERERGGKASALLEIFRRVTGDLLVLLNGDARADRCAVARLISAVEGARPPYAAMARAVPEPGPDTPTAEAASLMWEIQHEFYSQLGDGTQAPNLSDELVLLPREALPPLLPGIVNDGGFIASWLQRVGGRTYYVPDATVEIAIPRRLRDHVAQRRRILWGTRQLKELAGISPGTVLQGSTSRPAAAVRLLRKASSAHTTGARSLAILGAVEGYARFLAATDRLSGRTDHVRWVGVPS